MLFSAICSGLLGRKLGTTGSKIISVSCLILAAVISIICFGEVAFYGSPVYIKLFTWIDSELLVVDWSLWFDSLTIAMMSIVLTVSSLVHLYTCYYMAEDPHNQRFFSYLSLFTWGMCLLISGGNYLVMFAGQSSWPGYNFYTWSLYAGTSNSSTCYQPLTQKWIMKLRALG